MNTVILTGSPWTGVDTLFDQLQRFGVSPSLASRNNGKIISIGGWHDQLFSNKQLDQTKQIQLGKAWEQSAGEVFLANWGQETWGWADSRSTWLLDFWRDFDPQTRFILVHINPEQALAQAIASVDAQTPFVVDDVMATWLAYERELLRFYLRNQQRCLLVDFDQICLNPAGLAQVANELWDLGLEVEDSEALQLSFAMVGNPLADLLALQTMQRFPEALSLRQEIVTSLSLLPAAETETAARLGPDPIAELRNLIYNADIALGEMTQARDEQTALLQIRETQIELQQIEIRAQQEQNELQLIHKQQIQDELEQFVLRIQALESELQATGAELLNERHHAELYQVQVEQLNQERDAQIQTGNHLRQENELLLLQLHQVQEELEQYFLKSQMLDSELQVAGAELLNERQKAEHYQAQINQVGAERDRQAQAVAESQRQMENLSRELIAQAKLAEDRQAQINQIGAERDYQARIVVERQQQIEKLTQERNAQAKLAEDRQAQINQISAERGNQSRVTDECRQQIEKLTQERNAQAKLAEDRQAQISQISAERDNQARIAAERQQQVEKLNQNSNAQAKQVEERQQTQIKQLSSELDHQAQAAANLRQENELLLLQLHQVQEELEHYFLQYQAEQKQREQSSQRLDRILERWPDFVDMTGLQVNYTGQKNAQEIALTATDVHHSSRSVGEYSLRVMLKNKNPAIVIERGDAEQGSPLLRWPAELADEKAIVIPANTGLGIIGSAALPTSDWRLLQALTQTFAESLQRGAFQLTETGGKFNAAVWQQALTQLSQAIKAEANCLRYDSLKLKRQKVNPDYEHLWLQIGNLSFNDKQWPVAEFRLSAAAVKRGEFSIHPKLEFPQPETGAPLFENWHPDLEDDYGLKMEFRAEIQSQSVNIEFWNSISTADKALLLALIWHLPVFLKDLESQHVLINRPWQDWHKLVDGIMATIKARLIELGIS